MVLGQNTLQNIGLNFTDNLYDFQFYTGAAPATPTDTPAGTLVASFNDNLMNMWNYDNDFKAQDGVLKWVYDSWDTPSAHMVHAAAAAGGTIGFARLRVRDGYGVYWQFDLSVGLVGSGSDVELTKLDFTTGETIIVKSGNIQFNVNAG